MIRALALCLVLAQSAIAQSKTVERQLLAARDTIWHAWFTNDTVQLDRMLPEAAASGENGGEMHWSDRAAIMNQARDFARSGARLERLDFTNTHISLTGSVAVITSNYRMIVRSAARADTSRGHATEVFVRDGGRWVNPYWQLERGAR
jgi:hypothetical protein